QPPTPTPPFPTAESGVGVGTPNRLQIDSAESPGLQAPPPPGVRSWSWSRTFHGIDGGGAAAASGSGTRTSRWTPQQDNIFASIVVKCVADCAGKPNFNLGDLLVAEAQKHSVALGRTMSSQQALGRLDYMKRGCQAVYAYHKALSNICSRVGYAESATSWRGTFTPPTLCMLLDRAWAISLPRSSSWRPTGESEKTFASCARPACPTCTSIALPW
ncbi:hypothetical protein QJQ45_027252, partial [Haematococcus lacustris]